MPRPALTDEERARGLRMTIWQGVTATAMFSVVSSGFLASYALALGANNFQIGIMAAIPAIMQPFQVPAVWLVERLRLRKLIAVCSWYPAQAVWLFIGLIPLFVKIPSGPAVSMLLGLLAFRGVLAAITACSWNGWLRDLVPQETMGRFFSRRLAFSTVASVVFGLAGAFFVDVWRGQAPASLEVFGYTFVLVFGAVFLGLASPTFMALVPEPRMPPPASPRVSLLSSLAAPLKDRNYSHLMRFLLFWGFATNLAAPFFAVYMLTRLGLPLSVVIGFSVLSQLFNVMFLRVWGPLTDRYGCKSILSLCASLFLLVILGWTFTTMPERYALTIPLLVLLHVFGGIASAGLNVTAETIGLKLAPQGQATSYLVGVSLAANIGAGLGPLVGGRLADFFSQRQAGFRFFWTGPNDSIDLPAVYLEGFDFLFAIAFVLGLLTLNALTVLREEGEVEPEVVLDELYSQAQEMTRSVSSVPGLSFVAHIPYSLLRHAPAVPGMDVAAGVAAYQIAASVKSALTAASRGTATVVDVAVRVGHAVSRTLEQAGEVREHGKELARYATRGAIQAVDHVGMGVGHIAKDAVIGTLLALKKSHVDPEEALRGAGYGTIQGASDVGADLGQVAARAVEGARLTAAELGVSEETAAAQIARGVIEAAEAISPEAAEAVKQSVMQDLDATPAEAQKEGMPAPGS